MRVSKNREQLIHWAIQQPNEFFVFTARYLAQNDKWITFSQLYHEDKLIATHFNLPLHFSYLGKDYSFMPLDYQPQQRLIKEANFNLQDFVKTIELNGLKM